MFLSIRMKVSILAVPVVLALTVFPAATSAKSSAKPIKFDYLALGDSLAAGVTPYNEIGDGYTDFLAEKIGELGYLGSYTNRFSIPGYTTEDVLEDIKDDVEKDGKSIQDMIDDAELITLDAGANDLLKQIKVSDTGVSLDPAKVPVVLEQVKKNTSAILREIKKQNSRAKVYVMGYYNSFPYIPKEQQEQLIPILDMLNNVIADEAKRARAKFVPTADAIDEDFRTYLPNPQNIHLSEAGYQVVADEFWKEMKQEFSYRLTTDDRFIYMTKGQEQTLKLVIVYPSKKEIDVQKLAEWSSSNEDIVSVDEGVITAHKKGYAVITAKYEGQRIKISVRVN